MKKLFNFFSKDKEKTDSFVSDSEYEQEKLFSNITVTAATNVGKVRQHNEDNYYADALGTRSLQNQSEKAEVNINAEERYIFAVCDGMGGESYGDEASNIAIETLLDFSDKLKSADEAELKNVVNAYASTANDKICDMIRAKKCSRSGSTLVLVCLEQTKVYVFSIGDSRVYHYNGEKLVQITEDQTLAVKKLKANIYTEEEARTSPDAHKITSFLGMDNRGFGITALAYDPFYVNDGSVLLLCSDGLTDMCTDDEINEMLLSSEENLAQTLIDRALQNGGLDNVTCITVKI